MDYRIAAIIVTFNRLDCLKLCLCAIQTQSRKPDAIYIVNNASTDGTRDYLENLKSSIPITIINLLENQGGAGGFYTGLKNAFDTRQFDGYWLMDDDGIPENKCLQLMLQHFGKFGYVAPLVLSVENQEEVAFPYIPQKTRNEIIAFYTDGLIRSYSNPFNGILLSDEVVSTAGFPKKDMFIWGDEEEYNLRLQKHDISPVTVINAIHFHPKDRMEKKKDILGRKTIVFTESNLRNYCKYRNTTYSYKHYKSRSLLFKFIMNYSLYFCVVRVFDFKNLKLFFDAVMSGLKEDFNGHKKYIGK